MPLIALLERAGITVGHAEEQITAVLADSIMAGLLAVKYGSPPLMITRSVCDASDRCFEHLVAVYPPDRYRYSVLLGQ
jgi:GntR family transcriptional regulator